MTTLAEIQAVNPDKQIYGLSDPEFADYGEAYGQYDVQPILDFLDKNVTISSDGNLYVPSNPKMEAIPVVQQIGRDVYAGLPIEAGECAGHADSLTAVEFHQGSEVNVFATDVVMVIGKRGQMHNGQFNAEKDAKLFFVPAGSVVEFFSDTLHYSPCEAHQSGFKFIVMLIKGSNQSLPADFHTDNDLIMKTNKFQVVHKVRTDKIKLGEKIGVIGDLVHVNPVKEG
ncbi:DUF4867 family protein [Schleiferilactobacillus perolens]|uniref:DUF4867 domain-containing protein n=1 Tax=Schleiferilactobacillus perolens DSM 12744 TaxID=1423792 RepID=A0A0R1N085_9LACO|nr:DUF4867 family protein [Schleiferilactobacillus perolens]KRL13750.1 hypothetical protein FD09_GL001778 [Schleiferilactobacillus perolens DSM 12744]